MPPVSYSWLRMAQELVEVKDAARITEQQVLYWATNRYCYLKNNQTNLKCNSILQTSANIYCNFTTWVSQQPSTGTTKEVGGCKILILQLKAASWGLQDSQPVNCSFCKLCSLTKTIPKVFIFPCQERNQMTFKRAKTFPDWNIFARQ